MLALNLLLVSRYWLVDMLNLTPPTIDLEALCGVESQLDPCFCHGKRSDFILLVAFLRAAMPLANSGSWTTR